MRFNPGSESHRGLCHGGAMTSVLDDVLGEGSSDPDTVAVHLQLMTASMIAVIF